MPDWGFHAPLRLNVSQCGSGQRKKKMPCNGAVKKAGAVVVHMFRRLIVFVFFIMKLKWKTELKMYIFIKRKKMHLLKYSTNYSRLFAYSNHPLWRSGKHIYKWKSIALSIAVIIRNIKLLHLSQAMSVMFVSSGITASLILDGIKRLKGSPVLSVLLTSVVTHYGH